LKVIAGEPKGVKLVAGAGEKPDSSGIVFLDLRGLTFAASFSSVQCFRKNAKETGIHSQ